MTQKVKYNWIKTKGKKEIYDGDQMGERMDELEPKYFSGLATKAEKIEFELIIKMFTNQETMFDAVIKLPDCPKCLGTELKKLGNNKYQCKKCNHEFNFKN